MIRMNQNSIDLVFVIHNHQPVGNFDFVIEQTFNDSYEPFLNALEKHPNIRIGLHYTGYLWEYIADKHPDFIQRLKRLIDRNQVEILGGSYYEAILPILPENDADIQLKSYKNLMSQFSGVEADGIWLAERVWEPVLPSMLHKAGYAYTFLDQAHFEAAGAPSDRIWGIYRTEDRGNSVLVFPIDKTLRYYIPFSVAEKTMEELQLKADEGVSLITYGDDGEKFGGWPGTKKWVYEDGWLENFLQLLETNDNVRMLLPREAVKEHSPLGDIYLPCSSYEEMGEWTLPPKTQVELARLKDEWEKAGLKERTMPLIRGGFWRQYLAKYSESGALYRRMLRVSRKVAQLEQERPEKAAHSRRYLMKGQSNDAYWHGVFGGIYLPHLRHAVEKELIIAETICDRTSENKSQGDKFQPATFILQNDYLRCQVESRMGGGISAIDIRSAGFNLINTITRRREAYHERLLQADSSDQDDHISIHERLEVKEADLAEKVTEDDHPRFCALDLFLLPDFELRQLAYNRGAAISDFARSSYEIVKSGKKRIALRKSGVINDHNLIVNKTISLSPKSAAIKIEYSLEFPDNDSVGNLYFAPEFNINLMAPDAPDRFFLIDGKPFAGNNLGSFGDGESIKVLSLVDEYLGIRVDLQAETAVRWLWYPVETISLSEGGIERVYQGSGIHPVWQLNSIKRMNPVITIRIES